MSRKAAIFIISSTETMNGHRPCAAASYGILLDSPDDFFKPWSGFANL
jgi:hypothetical protein